MDLWISLDNVQNVKQSYIVRNRIKFHDGISKWLTIHLARPYFPKMINEVRLHRSSWHLDHLRKIKSYYRAAAKYDEVTPFLEELLIPCEDTLSIYNERLIRQMGARMGIHFRFKRASDVTCRRFGTPQEMVLNICQKVGATEYYNFQSGVENGLYAASQFLENGIRLFKQEYQHPCYYQQGEPFISHLSVLDLLFNHGFQNALEIIRSGRCWICEK